MLMLLYFVIFIVLALLVMFVVQHILHVRAVRSQINLRLTAMLQDSDDAKIFQTSSILDSSRSTASSNFIWSHLNKLFTQSGLQWGQGRLLIGITMLIVACHLSLVFLLPDLASRLVFGLLLALIIGYGYLVRLRAKRIRKFILALPDALGIVVRSLRAGHPLAEGVRMVAEEMPEPIGGEFHAMMNQLAMGAEAETAMIKMYHSVGSDEVKLMAVTLSIQSGTGGNLAEVFEKLSDTVRQRTMLAVKVKAISAEGRASAAIMSVFPLILFAIINFASPGYFDSVWVSDYAVHMVTTCLVAIGLGTLILMRMVDFDH